jgi:hypothetical protein
MANVQHADLTGADLHEPKGADAAAADTVYVADGLGSGAFAKIDGAAIDTASDISVATVETTGDCTVGGILYLGLTQIITGTGTPEGSVAAPVGSLFLRTDNANSFYVKQTLAGTTGWILK